MKTINKITRILTLSVIVIFSSYTYAQSTTMPVSASVNAALSITKNTNVSFGNVVQGTNGVMDPQGSGSSGLGSGFTLGKLTIAGTGTAGITLTFSESSVNLGDGASATMAFTPDFSGNGSDASSGSADINTGENVNLVSGAYYIYVGGTLTVGASQTAGSYSTGASNGGGDISVSVAYQ